MPTAHRFANCHIAIYADDHHPPHFLISSVGRPLIDQFKLYAPLRADAGLFATLRLSDDGGAIEWGGGEIDMAAASVERLASEQMTAEDFEAFLKRNGLTRKAAAALGRSLRMIQNYVEDEPIPRIVALACRGYERSQPARRSGI